MPKDYNGDLIEQVFKMKITKIKIALLLTVLMALSACDAPRVQRSVRSSQNNPAGFNLNPGVINPVTPELITTPVSVIPEDAKHCKFSTDGVNNFASNSTHLGAYTLCKSSTDANSFYFQIKTPPIGSNGDVKVCFIPTTVSGSNSIYVGNPMCGSFSDPKAVKKITFVKYSQYTNAAINGVMFFKDTSYYYPVFNRTMMTLAAYQGCMNMLTYGNPTYCEAFKSVGQYVFQSF